MKGEIMYMGNRNDLSLSEIEYLQADYRDVSHATLKGMFERGIFQQGLSNDDELLDIEALILTKVHKDKTILPIIVDMIFSRNRKGLFTHDLIWAFFGARDPYSLMLVANYLNSENIEDVKLACKLLDFVPELDMDTGKDSKKQYVSFLYWFKENYPFLHFTGESFQRSSKPIPYRVALDAKYLYRQVSVYTGEPLIPLTEIENTILGYFNNLDEENKLLLSKVSIRIHYEDVYSWKTWINSSITKQISIARNSLQGGLLVDN
jgi:hypothetical protein